MVLGPGGLVCNIVFCNASVFIELLDAHFFSRNDWMETSFHFIAYVDSISLVCRSSPHCIRHYCFNPLMQAFLILPHYSLLLTFATATIFLFIASNIRKSSYCCHSLFATIYPFIISSTADDTPPLDSKQEGHGLP